MGHTIMVVEARGAAVRLVEGIDGPTTRLEDNETRDSMVEMLNKLRCGEISASEN